MGAGKKRQQARILDRGLRLAVTNGSEITLALPRTPSTNTHILRPRLTETQVPCPSYSDHHPVGDDPILGNDDDAISNVIIGVVDLVRFARLRDNHIIANPRVLVNNRV